MSVSLSEQPYETCKLLEWQISLSLSCVVMTIHTVVGADYNNNLAVANISRASCADNTTRASVGLNITS